MAKGVIYIMTTVVDGLIKIGKTETKNFQNRMKYLEREGYRNVTGLKRCFAIEVENYDEKEILLHSIFDKSRVPGTELFALKVDLAVQLLSSLDGNQIFPESSRQTKEEVFEEVTERIKEAKVPEGTYYMERTINKKLIKGQMKVQNGQFIVLKGSDFYPESTVKYISGTMVERRNNAVVKNGKLQEDEEFNSATLAAVFLIGSNDNGLTRWKDKNGVTLKELIPSDKDDDE